MQVLLTKIVESYNPAHGPTRETNFCGAAVKAHLKKFFFTPVLAPLLQNRLLACILMAFGAAQLLLVFTGLAGWQCPIYETLGVRCPGCGMTTAVTMLLRGHWQSAIQTHAFAPLILFGLMLLPAVVVLPATHLKKLSLSLERLEQKIGHNRNFAFEHGELLAAKNF